MCSSIYSSINYLKPTETSHIIVLLSGWVCPNTPLKVFFGQEWSHKLKFSKLTKMLTTLLYTHFEFNVYFSKILLFTLFGQIWSQNLKFSKLTKIWYRGTLLCAYYDFNDYFSKILSLMFFGQIWSQNLMFSK